jgi:hypothetical protein
MVPPPPVSTRLLGCQKCQNLFVTTLRQAQRTCLATTFSFVSSTAKARATYLSLISDHTQLIFWNTKYRAATPIMRSDHTCTYSSSDGTKGNASALFWYNIWYEESFNHFVRTVVKNVSTAFMLCVLDLSLQRKATVPQGGEIFAVSMSLFLDLCDDFDSVQLGETFTSRMSLLTPKNDML